MQWLLIVLALAAGFYLLFKGADWMVDGAGRIARRLGISILVIGLTVVAFGTSAPAIVVSGLAAQQGKPDLALGNILGSNVANIGLVLGSCALVLPSVLQTRLPLREIFWLFASLGVFGFVAWDLLPLDFSEIEQVEVVRGPGSAVWGANAMSGVVNIITKTPRAYGN